MKINKIFISLILIFIAFLTINVKAIDVGYYLSNAELNYNYDSAPNEINVKRGDYIYVTAIINDVQGNGLTLKNGRVTVRWDYDYLELVSIDGKNYSLEKSSFSNLTVTEKSRTSNRITLDYSTNEIINQGINKLMEFKFRVLDNAKSGSTKIYEEDGEADVNCLKDEEAIACGTSYNSELKYNVESSKINTLSNIKIDDKPIENFNENITEYNVFFEGNKESINIEAVKKDERESINGDIGTRTLEYGLNTFNIEVTSESKDKRIYTIKAVRKDNRSSDNTLKDLKLSDGIIPFKKDITEYSVDVKNEVDKITVIAILNDAKAKFKEDYSKKEIDLIEGINKISIVVIAENNEEKTYTINITRKLSSNNTLKEITINNEKIKLNKNEFLYYYTVANDVESVTIDAKANDSNAIVTVDELSNLQVGENEIGISVTAPSGDIVKYTIIVTREQQLSSNAKLSNLEIVGYKLNFDKDTMYYDLKIKDDEFLELIYETEDENATVTVEGNKNLVNGSIVKINVKAEDNTVVRYFINIEKDSEGSSFIWIIVLLPLIIILTIIVIILIKKNKRKQNKKTKVESPVKEENINNVLEKFEESIDEDEQNTEEDSDNKEDSHQEEDKDVPVVDLEKTIVVKDLNPVIDEKESKKAIDLE